jgi:hypothetical protein
MVTQDVSPADELGHVYDVWHLEHSANALDRRQRASFEWIVGSLRLATEIGSSALPTGGSSFSRVQVSP